MIQRVNQADQTVIPFPKSTRFGIASLGLVFTNLEDAEINESQTMIELLVQCQTEGIAGNIAAQQQWQLPIKPDESRVTGLITTNPNAFSQGVDQQSGGLTANLLSNEVSDQKIQDHLDAATAQVRDRLGLKADEDMPISIRIDQAVYCLSLFAIEQTSSQRVNKEMRLDDFVTERRTHFPRDGMLREAIDRKVLSLIHPFRKNLRFMPDVPGQVD